MPPRAPVDQQIAELQRLAKEGLTPGVVQALSRALKHSSNLMVAKGAELCSELQARELLPLLAKGRNRGSCAARRVRASRGEHREPG
jgi:hypothetical protein